MVLGTLWNEDTTPSYGSKDPIPLDLRHKEHARRSTTTIESDEALKLSLKEVNGSESDEGQQLLHKEILRIENQDGHESIHKELQRIENKDGQRLLIKDERGYVPPPDYLQKEAILDYDLDRFPFVNALRKVLNENEDADLSQLHKTISCQRIVTATTQRPVVGPRQNPWNKAYQAARNIGVRTEDCIWWDFMGLYHDFVQNYILDALSVDYVAFQSYPSFRCHLPYTGAVGRPHRDADYAHGSSEINYWLPVTEVFDTNSLQTESKRDQSDFHPIVAKPGQVCQFYGNQVFHYNVNNETNATRVSIDFRVIRKTEGEWSAESFDKFRLGEYFKIMSRSGLVEVDTPEFKWLVQEAR